MKNKLTILILVFLGGVSYAQPPLIQRDSLGYYSYLPGNVFATDSCYYTTGSVLLDGGGLKYGLAFVKYGFDGMIEDSSFYFHDSLSYELWESHAAISTADGNFAMLSVSSPFLTFIKLSPEGDTLFTNVLDEFYTANDQSAVRVKELIELVDGSFVCYVAVDDVVENKPEALMLFIDGNGNLLNQKTFVCVEPDYEGLWAGGLYPTSDGGYLLSNSAVDFGTLPSNSRQNLRLIKTDGLGNETWTWTEWGDDQNFFVGEIEVLNDGSYLIPYQKGDSNGGMISAVRRLDDSFIPLWSFDHGLAYTSVDQSGFDKLIKINEQEYVACGTSQILGMTVGDLVKFNLDGDILWDSQFTVLPDLGAPNQPVHSFFDLDTTMDGGFVMVGQAWDTQEDEFFGWIVKTDSVGCLLPDCQDFLSEPYEKADLKLSIYPNPVVDVLYISLKSGELNGLDEVRIVDTNGKSVRTWTIANFDNTFVFSTRNLPGGAYFVQILGANKIFASQKFLKL